MTEELLKERKVVLEKGLNTLLIKVEELLKMIDVQKGSISECEYWLKEIEKKKV